MTKLIAYSAAAFTVAAKYATVESSSTLHYSMQAADTAAYLATGVIYDRKFL